MRRRNFLALAGLAGARSLHASDPPDACGYPVAFPPNPIHDPIVATQPVDLPTGAPIERPLWSKLSPWDQERLALKMKAAYDRMARRGDTRSLFYQAWQHAWYCGADVSNGINVHDTADFLPWHRAFLYVHERLLQAELGDDRSFRLPVWDWENDPEVPWVYHLISGVKGPCYAARLNRLPPITKPMLSAWLLSGDFDVFACGQAWHGVHSFVHGNLGDTSYIGDPRTAAADPLFFAHHANIDRYWIYWWNFYKDRYQAHWPDSTYPLYGPRGPVNVSMANLQDPALLGYSYEPPPDGLLYDPITVTAVPDSGTNILKFAVDEWQKLVDYLQKLAALPSLLNAGIPNPFEIVKQVTDDIFKQIGRYSKIDHLRIPVQVVVSLSGLEPGRYYLVELRPVGAAHGPVIGGFGVFAVHNNHPMKVYPLLDLDIEGVLTIASSLLEGFRLVYGPQRGDHAIDGPGIPLTPDKFSLRLNPGL